MKIFARNKKAYFNYEIKDKLEAGIELIGAEVKYLTSGKVNIGGAYAKILQGTKKPELYLINAKIGDGEGSDRSRRLLLHRYEINKLIGLLQEKNLSLVPLIIYGKRGLIKLELGLGKGKKSHDKREVIKKRDLLRTQDKRIT